MPEWRSRSPVLNLEMEIERPARADREDGRLRVEHRSVEDHASLRVARLRARGTRRSRFRRSLLRRRRQKRTLTGRLPFCRPGRPRRAGAPTAVPCCWRLLARRASRREPRARTDRCPSSLERCRGVERRSGRSRGSTAAVACAGRGLRESVRRRGGRPPCSTTRCFSGRHAGRARRSSRLQRADVLAPLGIGADARDPEELEQLGQFAGGEGSGWTARARILTDLPGRTSVPRRSKSERFGFLFDSIYRSFILSGPAAAAALDQRKDTNAQILEGLARAWPSVTLVVVAVAYGARTHSSASSTLVFASSADPVALDGALRWDGESGRVIIQMVRGPRGR